MSAGTVIFYQMPSRLHVRPFLHLRLSSRRPCWVMGADSPLFLIVLAVDLKKLRSRLVSSWLLGPMSDGAGAFIFHCDLDLLVSHFTEKFLMIAKGASIWLRGQKRRRLTKG